MSETRIIEAAPVAALAADMDTEAEGARRLGDARAADLLASTAARLRAAVEAGANPPPVPTVEEIARVEGVTPWAIYKRRQRGRPVSRRQSA